MPTDDTGQVELVDADGYGHLLRYTHHDVVHSYCLAVLVPAYFPGRNVKNGMPWSNSDTLVRVLMISHVWGRIYLILYIECKTEIEYP